MEEPVSGHSSRSLTLKLSEYEERLQTYLYVLFSYANNNEFSLPPV